MEHRHFWRYFQTIESDLIRLSRYIEFDTTNYNTYSVELSRILLAAGSEIDVMMRQLCVAIDNTSTDKTMKTYAKRILSKEPDIVSMKVFISDYDIELSPFNEWTSTRNPQWWIAYNQVKHNRDNSFNMASLKNVLDIVSALFIIEILYYRYCTITDEKPNPINRARANNNLESILFDLEEKYDPHIF